MKTKPNRPNKMWAMYNYGRLVAVEWRRKDFAAIFCGGAAEMKANITNGSMSVRRVLVTPIEASK